MAVPKFNALFNPMLQAIRKLGGSASIAELDEEVTNSLHLTDEDIAEPHGERGTELQYRLAWARTYLKAFGLLDNTARGVWVLTEKGQHVDSVDPRQVTRFVRDSTRGKGSKQPTTRRSATVPDVAEVAEAVLERTWREKLLATL